MTALIIIATVLGLCSTVGGVYWLAIALRMSRAMEDRPTILRGLEVEESSEPLPKLSIIVPAHNEQRVIRRCAESLRAQDYPDIEFIFVLDRCTDDTLAELRAAAADDPRIRIVENDSCPDDWAGKCNAARIGAEHATGDWLLFTDADTMFDPRLCRAAVALARKRGLALLSLLSTLSYDQRFERIIQPVAALNLMKMFPLERVNRAENARAFANGQFMLFDRTWYERIDGHHSVKHDLLEDIAFARRINNEGGRGGVALSDGMLMVSMYDSMRSFLQGWKRIFIEGCKRKPARLRKYAWRILLIGVSLQIVQAAALVTAVLFLIAGHPILAIPVSVVTFLSLIMQFSVLRRIYPMGGAPRSAVWFYPLGAFMVMRVMFEAASDLENRRPVVWGGREYILEPR